MSKARYATAGPAATICALRRATTTSASSATCAKSAHQRRDCASNHKNWRVSASRYAKRAPVDQHPPGSTPRPSIGARSGWNPRRLA